MGAGCAEGLRGASRVRETRLRGGSERGVLCCSPARWYGAWCVYLIGHLEQLRKTLVVRIVHKLLVLGADNAEKWQNRN